MDTVRAGRRSSLSRAGKCQKSWGDVLCVVFWEIENHRLSGQNPWMWRESGWSGGSQVGMFALTRSRGQIELGAMGAQEGAGWFG